MLNIDNILKKLKMNDSLKKYGILLTSIMFIWSGINKIRYFSKKVETLSNKTNIHQYISTFGMCLVILLEIVGFLLLVEYFFGKRYLYNIIQKINIFVNLSQQQLIQIILLMLLIFLVVVTYIYHPLDIRHPIPFLSNVSTFGLLLYVYSDL
jgi:hypothetical protein